MATLEKKKIVDSALKLFAQQGLSNTTLEDISKHSNVPLDTIFASYDMPGDILQETFKSGQRKMEEMLREPILGGLEAHVGKIFDGLEAMISPWGPELYLNTLYQATKDRVLRDAFSRTSRTMGFAVKSFLANMVAMSIVDEIEGVEKVNETLVTSFIESLAQVLNGESMENIKIKWVSAASALFTPSSATHVPFSD